MRELHELLRQQIERYWGDAGPVPSEVAGFVYEVSETYRQADAEREALKRLVDLYRGGFDSSQIAIITVDEDDTIVRANPSFERLSGYTREELENRKKWTEFLVQEEPVGAEHSEATHAGSGEDPSHDPHLESRFKSRTGVVRSCTNDICPIPGSSGKIIFMLDLTHMKRLQGQLVHAAKMEAIGTLASGVAHDFNNLLMGIQGHVSLMLLGTQDYPEIRERLEGIDEHVRSGAALAKQLLGFSRIEGYRVKPINLNEVVGKTATMFGRTRKDIAIHVSLQPDLWTVEADEGEIERVLLNLLVNAGQAMAGGGELYLETRNCALGKGQVHPLHLPAGRYVKVSTTDTGVGMDEKVKARIFEPFFTTRESGRGTGLGLTSAYATIKGHRGIITVYSEEGRGSTFNIYLPASRKKKGTSEKPVREKEIRGSESILLVDDEPSILDVGKQLLELLGYRVFVAVGGVEAIDLFRERAGQIDLVILDMVMPRMGGGETFDRLKEIDPAVRVVLSSGYSLTGEANRIVEKGCRGFIQKPFTPAELSKKIREALDRDSEK